MAVIAYKCPDITVVVVDINQVWTISVCNPHFWLVNRIYRTQLRVFAV